MGAANRGSDVSRLGGRCREVSGEGDDGGDWMTDDSGEDGLLRMLWKLSVLDAVLRDCFEDCLLSCEVNMTGGGLLLRLICAGAVMERVAVKPGSLPIGRTALSRLDPKIDRPRIMSES